MNQERNTLSARSLVLSLLLGMRRPRRPAHELVAWCGLFGIADGTARVALSRMVAAGELANVVGVYELAGRVRDRSDEQAFALAPDLVDDADSWWMEVVTAGARGARDRTMLRNGLRHSGYREQREGVWLRPANLRRTRPAVAVAQCDRYRVYPDRPKDLAAMLFDPQGWGATARILARELAHAQADIGTAEGLAQSFVVGTRAAAHLRADPLLPAGLCRANDRGDTLRAEYREFQGAFGPAIRDWFASL